MYLIGDTDELRPARDALAAVAAAEQHEPFVPHITAGYGLDVGDLSYTGPVTFTALRVALGDDVTDLQLGDGGAEMTAAAPTQPTDVEIVSDTGDELRIRIPCVVPEGMDTSDGRYIHPGALTHRPLPLPILAQTRNPDGGDGHDGAEVIGRFDALDRVAGPEVTRRSGEPFADDVWIWQAGEAVLDGRHPAADLFRKGYLGGVSVDLTDVDAELVAEEDLAESEHPKRRAIMHAGEIAALTLVPIPAFGDAYAELADDDGSGEPPDTGTLAAAGLMTDPVPAWRSADIGDTCGLCLADGDVEELLARTPGGNVTAEQRRTSQDKGHAMPDGSFPIESAQDLDNAIRQVGRANDAAAARRHIIRQARRLGLTDRIPDHWNPDGSVKESQTAAAPPRPPAGWFTDPQLGGPTPVTVTDEGRVYGHLAVFDQCHVGFPGQCVTAPRSAAGYAYFTTGALVCDTGEEVPVGHITMETGHADTTATRSAAAAHYDNTGLVVADVAAGEDRHGVWVAGAIRPGVDDTLAARLRAAALSGDWRQVNGNLELVAALAVNVPGFPVPRTRVASGQPQSLVAAGAVPADAPRPDGALVLDYDTLADAIATRLAEKTGEDPDTMAQLLDDLDERPEQMAELLAELADGAEEFDISTMPPHLQKSYLTGKVAARIRWGVAGDFKRCVAQARIHGMGRKAEGACANLHNKALGFYPGPNKRH